MPAIVFFTELIAASADDLPMMACEVVAIIAKELVIAPYPIIT